MGMTLEEKTSCFLDFELCLSQSGFEHRIFGTLYGGCSIVGGFFQEVRFGKEKLFYWDKGDQGWRMIRGTDFGGSPQRHVLYYSNSND